MPATTSSNRGAVVLLPFPFSDQSAVKLRPAIVVHPPYPSEDLIVAAVTSIGDGLRPGEFPIQFWREAGLLHPSFAKRALASVSSNLVRKPLASCVALTLPNLIRPSASGWACRR
jgi:mRNA interferase MazF